MRHAGKRTNPTSLAIYRSPVVRRTFDLFTLGWLRPAAAISSARNSIVRRSLWITGFTVLGHGFYYALLLTANRLLSAGGFGRFYAGWSVLNVLVMPTSIFTMLLTNYLSETFRRAGGHSIPVVLGNVARRYGPVALGVALALEALFYLLGKAVHVDSVGIGLIVPLTALSFVAVEGVRACFPAILRATWFGVSWVLGCVAQCFLGAAALFVFQAPWAGFLGMLCANIGACAIFSLVVVRLCSDVPLRSAAIADFTLTSFRGVLPFGTALGTFVVFNNADVLVAYLFMDPSQLGAYAAAALLPKAIVTATQPATQMILPVLISVRSERVNMRQALAKAIVATFALAGAGAVVLWATSDVLCGGRYGIELCSRTPMLALAAAAVAFALMRVVIIIEAAAGRYIVAHLPILVLCGFIIKQIAAPSSGEALAVHYAWAAFASIGLMVVTRFAQFLRDARLAESR
ncbi:MAG: hypothetical protein JO128_18480 [Alphaproteobacteria bacterium]|nr:hypothetical protein [Alphaproteobacteria bacterium]